MPRTVHVLTIVRASTAVVTAPGSGLRWRVAMASSAAEAT